jgi:hypothetical protein
MVYYKNSLLQGKLWRSGRMGTEGYVDRGSDISGALCELPQKTQAARIWRTMFMTANARVY